MSAIPANNHVRECPYGHGASQFVYLHDVSAFNYRIDPKDDSSSWQSQHVVCCKCVVCGGPLFMRAYGPGFGALEVYPRKAPDAHQDIPSPIRAVYLEAQACHSVQAWNATAAMCRRAIQEAVLKLGGTGKFLFDQIEYLAGKNIIVPDLKDWAHEVRGIGRDGAHADVLTDVTEGDANDALEFTKEFLNYAFVLKQRLQRRKPATIQH